ncbi:tetratricopeptide repeat protein [Comamonas testosteroni]|uniref:tetratricopeptide repeat protein n=1 Tax=Comamonas testosteroni TaxID=285 RepID=UPI00389AA332
MTAAKGHDSGHANLAVMYAAGRGVPLDEKEAARLLGLAAEQGNATAQVNLGTMFEEGRGVRRSLSQAYFWYALAAAQGLEDTVSLRDAAARKLKPAERAAQDSRISRWKPKPQMR